MVDSFPPGVVERRLRAGRGRRRLRAPPPGREGHDDRLVGHGQAHPEGRGRHAHAEHLRARRQVAQHRVRRRRPRRRRLRRDHPVGLHVQRRPGLRGRIAHPDPAPGARRDARAHPGHRRVHRPRRPARPGHGHGSADLQGAVRQGRPLPRDRAEGSRPRVRRSTRPRGRARPAQRPLGRADAVPVRRQLDPDLSRGDLRPGGGRHPLRHRGRSRRPRQRQPIRPGIGRVDPRPRLRPADGTRHPVRQRVGQQLHADPLRAPLRRHQGERLRPRHHPRVHAGEDRGHLGDPATSLTGGSPVPMPPTL